MEKLIKLLNKYLKYKEDIGPDKLTRVKSVDTTGDIIFELNNGGHWNLWYVISKEYGFIKWLVENDKIDIEKIENSEYYLIDWFYYNERKKFGMEWKEDVEKIFLMLLSISDTPIDDLISYLK